MNCRSVSSSPSSFLSSFGTCSPRSSALGATVLAGLLLLAPEAEARFGKHSSSSHSGSRPGRSGSSTHAASPVRASTPPRSPGSSPRPQASRSSTMYARTRTRGYSLAAPATVGVSASPEDEWDAPRNHFVIGFDMQAVGRGGGASLHLGLETGRLGLMLRGGGLTLRGGEGRGEDALGLLSAHVSYAVLVSERGRVRLEGGVSSVRAPDATFVGPSVGSSAEYYLLDSLAVEGRMHLTPVPHHQLDTAVGLAWFFFEDVVALRGGMRLLFLDDAGLVDHVIRRDLLAGPYLSLGLTM